MQDAIEVGDEIVTAGGLYGFVTAVDEDELEVEIAPDVVVRVATRAVAAVVDDGEEEDDDDAANAPEADEAGEDTPDDWHRDPPAADDADTSPEAGRS